MSVLWLQHLTLSQNEVYFIKTRVWKI